MSLFKKDEESDDLCSSEKKLQKAIELFNDIFGFEEENTLSFFFPAGDILRLLSTEQCIGLKIFPALDDHPKSKNLKLTMVVKPFAQPDDLTISKEAGKGEKETLLKATPAICCPTPGLPMRGNRDEKIEHWIEGLEKLLKEK